MEDSTYDPPPQALSVEDKVSIVLSVISGRESVAEAAGRRTNISEQAIEDWREAFIEGGLLGLQGADAHRPPLRESRLVAEMTELKTALGEVCLELNVWQALRRHRRRTPDKK
ncbi:helix-turn-helix domain-containing protein [Streptomyces sp. ISL-10]|uniref:helix-turn-helix domain-containing protein n=1 Tax=Streptomyces sp. ISL-10 TaxID=2819172 RepID=UPI001BE988E4|nr:helix-turn-helix domain-containing protein [Streptomyces sp. ISL-10]MBT2365133.1 helix-turn-helix domain-containing protein [Streptomyces sp. ISL-10]